EAKPTACDAVCCGRCRSRSSKRRSCGSGGVNEGADATASARRGTTDLGADGGMRREHAKEAHHVEARRRHDRAEPESKRCTTVIAPVRPSSRARVRAWHATAVSELFLVVGRGSTRVAHGQIEAWLAQSMGQLSQYAQT